MSPKTLAAPRMWWHLGVCGVTAMTSNSISIPSTSVERPIVWILVIKMPYGRQPLNLKGETWNTRMLWLPLVWCPQPLPPLCMTPAAKALKLLSAMHATHTNRGLQHVQHMRMVTTHYALRLGFFETNPCWCYVQHWHKTACFTMCMFTCQRQWAMPSPVSSAHLVWTSFNL